MKRFTILSTLAMAVMTTTGGASPRGKASGACPTGDKLVALARVAFPDAVDPKGFACRVVKARKPTWLLTGSSECGEADAGSAAIVQDGAVTWSEPHVGTPGNMCNGHSWDLTDLDGDGSDELFELREYVSHEGSSHSSLTISALVEGVPTGGDTLELSDRGTYEEDTHHHSYDCEASYRLLDGPHGIKRIELVGHGYAPELRCLTNRRHVYVWRGRRLVAQ
jgi:hypothetical protein